MTLKLTLQTSTDNILNHIVHKSSADFYLKNKEKEMLKYKYLSLVLMYSTWV